MSTPTTLASGASDPSYSDIGATLKNQFTPRWSWSVGVSHADNAAFYARTAAFTDPSESKDIGGTRVFALVQAAGAGLGRIGSDRAAQDAHCVVGFAPGPHAKRSAAVPVG